MTRDDDMEADVRKAVHGWMRRVLDENRWSAERWGRMAGTAPTNIQRLLRNPETAPLPNLTTVYRLAAVAKSMPDLGIVSKRLNEVPVVSEGDLRDYLSSKKTLREIRASASTHVRVAGEVDNSCIAATVTGDSLVFRGVSPGDTVLITALEARAPEQGDIVAVMGDDGLDCFEWGPPWLLAMGPRAGQHMPVETARGRIVGVVTDVIKKLSR